MLATNRWDFISAVQGWAGMGASHLLDWLLPRGCPVVGAAEMHMWEHSPGVSVGPRPDVQPKGWVSGCPSEGWWMSWEVHGLPPPTRAEGRSTVRNGQRWFCCASVSTLFMVQPPGGSCVWMFFGNCHCGGTSGPRVSRSVGLGSFLASRQSIHGREAEGKCLCTQGLVEAELTWPCPRLGCH